MHIWINKLYQLQSLIKISDWFSLDWPNNKKILSIFSLNIIFPDTVNNVCLKLSVFVLLFIWDINKPSIGILFNLHSLIESIIWPFFKANIILSWKWEFFIFSFFKL